MKLYLIVFQVWLLRKTTLCLWLLLLSEEAKGAVFSIPLDSAPGPDWFFSCFFLKCWEIIKGDILQASRDFFGGMELPTFYTASFITMIPKVENPISFYDFRPVSPSY